ncbi:PREDICTED: aspartic proteinase CDR1-like [Fragaria vesca subsp. vesca]|uniref:aspartic proteinase CDR1-like n=1 Tax=Fragaria vesca subsp. vesca TaxID=101020 RepID=UPI0002C36BEE|nr:PREDICTED: aspartic proteinase CDR1-like [Fragaria vesca subsp. vesca]
MAKQYHSLSTTIATSIVFLLVLSNAQDNAPHSGGVISLNMIHRDKPSSPLYDASLTDSQRVSKALQLSRHRINRFVSSEDESPGAHLIYSSGEYLVNMSIGTPPRPFIGIVDSGSDLIWTQCMPCTECFKQNPPLFDPASSSTYKALSCASNECRLVNEATLCSSNSSSCGYQASYGDGSYSNGNLSLDTVTLDSISIPNTIFGCGHHNGEFTGVESGIVGLGRGAVSFISQIGGYLVGGKYFSYCLVPNPAQTSFQSNNSNPVSSSKMYFGRLNTSSGPGVVTTPLLRNPIYQSFYYLELQGISVGANNITVDADAKDFKGNMIIDSGTTSTYLPESVYDRFERAIREELKDRNLEVKQDPTGGSDLCYLTKYDILAGPNVTFHFNGADVKLNSANNFIRMDDETVCLAFSSGSSFGIYGIWQQTNYLVGYDLENKTVSFQPTACATI